MLVVVLWLPEVGFEGSLQQLYAINQPTNECARWVDGDRAVVGGDDDVPVLFLHLPCLARQL